MDSAAIDRILDQVSLTLRKQLGGVKRVMMWRGHEIEYFMDVGHSNDIGLAADHPLRLEDIHDRVLLVEDPFGNGDVGKYRAFLYNEDFDYFHDQARNHLDRIYPNGVDETKTND